MAASPIYIGSVRASGATATTANTNIDGNGTLATVFTAGSSGSRINTVQIKGRVAAGSTQAADTLRLYLDDGTNKHPLREVTVAAGAGVVSVSVTNFESTLSLNIDIPAGWILKAAPHVGGALGSYEVTAFGGDY